MTSAYGSRKTYFEAASAAALAALVAAAGGCDRAVLIGERLCLQAPAATDGALEDAGLLALPWSTGFEDGFCAYEAPTGFCYGGGSHTYELVTTPVHSGRYAAAFKVQPQVAAPAQVRCVRQGVLPESVRFGAWYFLPSGAENTGLWNLFHYQGGRPGGPLDGLWDVSLVHGSAGLQATLYDFAAGPAPRLAGAPAIPIGRWFHLEVVWRRAQDETGEIQLLQDGRPIARFSGIVTDDTDWGQWYVGNLATALMPSASTLYVDDVTIEREP